MSSTSNIYFSELERLKTFRENGWPHSFLSPEIMAKCGFYYTGIRDQVKCPFCDIVIFYWDDAAEPIDEHIFASKNCRFVNGYDVGNIFIGNDPREIFELSPKEEVETKKILSNNEKKRLRKKKKKMDEQSSRLNEVTDLMIRQMFEDDIDI
uniref:Uncharacterized protein n=2 Tax=Tetranychus urticae TaxID=32264 RepID=T1JTC6_TETUR